MLDVAEISNQPTGCYCPDLDPWPAVAPAPWVFCGGDLPARRNVAP